MPLSLRSDAMTRMTTQVSVARSVEAQEIFRLRTALYSIAIGLAGARSWVELRTRTEAALRAARLALGPAGATDATEYPPLSDEELEQIQERCFRQSELPFSAAQEALRLCHEVTRLRAELAKRDAPPRPPQR
jgi:hypothetical protein